MLHKHKLEKIHEVHSDIENTKEKPNKFYPSLERTASLKEVTTAVTAANKVKPRWKKTTGSTGKLSPWKDVDTYWFTIAD